MAQCMICGVHSSRNKNDSGFVNEYGEKMILCTTHNAAAEEVTEDGLVNWLALITAAARIRSLAFEHPEQRDDLVQLEPLVSYYRQFARAPDIIAGWERALERGAAEQRQNRKDAEAQVKKKQAALQKKGKAAESAKKQG